MMGRSKLLVGLLMLMLSLSLVPALAPAQEKSAPPITKIGVPNTLFRDVPAGMIQVLTPSFLSLMRDQTGLEGELVMADDAFDLGRRLNDKEVQVAIFHGFEFAWAQDKYPELKPLAVAVNRHATQRALLMIRNDSAAASLADLKGKTLSVPRRSREHCLLFLERECQALGTDVKGCFGKVVNHANIEDALDDILRDKVQVVVVDSVALETYEQTKSGCFARLKVLKQSEAFPAAVVAYRQGALGNAAQAQFREGMITANQSARGRDLLALWRLTAFEEVPADFPKTLAVLLKVYPPPAPAGLPDKSK
jgi:ABC-type phosphate/phosphonate transport system substrate-binding protein